MSKVPESLVKAACAQLSRQQRDLRDLLHLAKRHQQDAEDYARQARECLEAYNEATGQFNEVMDWLHEYAADQLEPQ